MIASSRLGIKPKTIKLVFVASLLRTQHYGVRANTLWLTIRIKYLSVETCLPTELFLCATTNKSN